MPKSNIWEKSCSWDIDQSALSQSDCRIFKSAISPEQISGAVSFFGLQVWLSYAEIDCFKNEQIE